MSELIGKDDGLVSDLESTAARIVELEAQIASARNYALEQAAFIAERTHSGMVASKAIRQLKRADTGGG